MRSFHRRIAALLASGLIALTAGCAAPGKKESINMAGLSQPVEIVRDKHGVSHIYAQNQNDLFFAQGFSAARDRLWQLDLWRRQGEGKMAEQFGPRFIEQDRAARLFLFRGDMQAEFASYHPEGQAILTAFAAGINAYVDWVKANPDQLPPEFKLTGTLPGYWRPETSLIRIYGLTRNLNEEVKTAQQVASLGLNAVQGLSTFEPPLALQVPAGLDVRQIDKSVLANYTLARNGQKFVAADFPRSPLAADKREALASALSEGRLASLDPNFDPLATRYESNNWTIGGQHTDTGKPILAGDPHRSITMPSLRYMVHLNAPGWNVIGAGEPALPGVSMGHNDRIAFGLTIFAFGDEEDLYVYDTNPANPNEYRYRGGWEKMRQMDESIPVRGEAAAVRQLKFTRHGPVIHEDPVRHKAYALRAAYLEFPGTAAYLASLRLNQAQNWNEFVAGMEKHYTPSENMVYADVDGNIGWFGGSIAPIRPRNDWSGMLPVPGNGDFEWRGVLPGSALPRAYNPPEGYVATANEFNLPADYAYRDMSARTWAEPYRVQRIREVLADGSRLTVQQSQDLQYDNLSIPARTLGTYAKALNSADPAVNDALGLLKDWDYRMDTDSRAATVYAFWLPEVVKRVSDLYVPANGRAAFGDLSTRKTLEKLAAPDAAFGAQPERGRDALLLQALNDGVQKLRAKLGPDSTQWQWGKLHHIQFEHSLASLLPPETAKAYGTPRYPVGGDNDTVHRGTFRKSDFRQISGSSYRQVIDVANWDNSRVQNVPGQSADPRSPYYQDLLKGWATGEYFPMAFSRAKVDSEKADTLTLKPTGN
ncbi:penicillin acylase family protein [Achromobacter piechaudii]|uniref:Penicillin acylase 2 proenzyme n=2 Tax=Achromobacter piechaudii TaxID=72556 RepID=A0ABN7F1N6_9BURK|nr:penicillin amidase [Achromobacter piechaudii ATCC 43553]CAB3715479.1 Penicillin acylase 2 proenzyme [Achromobacter piechaudii]CAB3882505.1 Penicillin acylase 2 proenzyme [Achromobacter piechaudii]CAB3952531.1 Penicillin acylase 2 proenzyme [Achromobacter piechaudii]